MQKILKLRVSQRDLEAFTAAADVTGQTISGWMRFVLLERAAEMRAKGVII